MVVKPGQDLGSEHWSPWGVVELRDLGVEVHSWLKVVSSVSRVVEAFGILAFINLKFESKTWEVM